jgi:hypothetical protein
VLINPERQKSEDRVNIPPCLNHLEEQKSANPEELKSQEDHVNIIPHPVLINPQEQKSEDRVNIPPCLNHS